MKKLLLALTLLTSAAALHATTLATDTNIWAAAAYNCSSQTLGTSYFLNAQSSSLNTVRYDASVVTVGSPSGSYTYSMQIKVYDNATLSNYSTTNASIQSGASVLISVPSNHAYTVTFWISSCQPPPGAGYKEVDRSNLTISN